MRNHAHTPFIRIEDNLNLGHRLLRWRTKWISSSCKNANWRWVWFGLVPVVVEHLLLSILLNLVWWRSPTLFIFLTSLTVLRLFNFDSILINLPVDPANYDGSNEESEDCGQNYDHVSINLRISRGLPLLLVRIKIEQSWFVQLIGEVPAETECNVELDGIYDVSLVVSDRRVTMHTALVF